MRIVREKEERTKDLWHCQLPFLRNFLEYNRTSLFFKEELCRGYIYPDSVDMVTAGHESGRSARHTPWEGSYPMVAWEITRCLFLFFLWLHIIFLLIQMKSVWWRLFNPRVFLFSVHNFFFGECWERVHDIPITSIPPFFLVYFFLWTLFFS